MSPTIK